MAVALGQWHNDTFDKTAAATGLLVQISASGTAIGRVLITCIAFDNVTATTPTVSTIAKPAGETNSWVKLASFDSSTATGGGGMRGEIWGITMSVTWAASSTYAVTLSGAATAKIQTCADFSGLTLALRGTAGAGTSTSGAISATTAGTAPATGDLVLGWAGNEGTTTPPPGDTDTTNGSWTQFSNTVSNGQVNTTGGSTATNIAGTFLWKIVTAGGHQTYNMTGAGDSGACVVALTATPPPSTPASAPTVAVSATEEAIDVTVPALAGGATSYDIYRDGVQRSLSRPPGVFTVTGEDAVTTQTYTLRGHNSVGVSADSPASSPGIVANPKAPVVWAVVPGYQKNRITLTGRTYAAKYKVYRGLSGGARSLVHTSTLQSANAAYFFDDTGLVNGTAYDYHVTTEAQTPTVRESAASSIKSGTPTVAMVLRPATLITAASWVPTQSASVLTDISDGSDFSGVTPSGGVSSAAGVMEFTLPSLGTGLRPETGGNFTIFMRHILDSGGAGNERAALYKAGVLVATLTAFTSGSTTTDSASFANSLLGTDDQSDLTLKVDSLATGTTVIFDVWVGINAETGGTNYTSTPSDLLGLTDSIQTAVTLDRSDVAVPTDTASRGVTIDRSDNGVPTDAVTAGLVLALDVSDTTGLVDTSSRAVTLDRSDVASLLRDGGGSNVLDAASGSFEVDTNADGIADGWIQSPSFSVGGFTFGPATTASIVSVISGGDGTSSQQLTTSSSVAVNTGLLGPMMPIGGIQVVNVRARFYNPGGTSTDEGIGLVFYNAGLTAVGATAQQGTLTAGQVLNLSVVGTAPATAVFARAYVGFGVNTTGTLQIDNVILHDWSASPALDFATGPTKIVTIDRSDVAVPMDTKSTVITSDRSDTTGLTDSVIVGLVLIRDYSDAVAPTDTKSAAGSIDRPDTTGITDAASAALSFGRDYSDVAVPTDASSRAVVLDRSDNAAPTDAASPVLAGTDYTLDKSDPTGLVDTDAETVTLDRSDTTGLVDVEIDDDSLSVTDNAGLTDTATVDRAVSAADSAGLTDSAAAGLALVRNYSDTAGQTDVVASVVSKTTSDTTGLTDAAASVRGLSTTPPTDNAGLVDSRSIAVSEDNSDTATLTDSVALTVQISRQDTTGLTDTATTGGNQAVTTADPAGLTDTAASTVDRALTADSAGLSDTSAKSVVLDRPDPAGLTDTSTTAATSVRSASDVTGLVDRVELTLARTVSDQANLTDATSLDRASQAADLENLTDSVDIALVRAYAASDDVTLSDAVSFALALGLDVTDTVGSRDTFTVAGGNLVRIGAPGLRVSTPTAAVHVDTRAAAVAVDTLASAVAVDTPAAAVAVDVPSVAVSVDA